MAHEFHWGAMALAALAAFIVGFLWYGPLFGRRWGEEQGFDMDEKPDMSTMWWPMLGNFFGNFLTAYALTWVISHMGGNWDGFHMVFMPALIIWTGFYVPKMFNEVGWEQRSWGYGFINAGHALVQLVLIGTMIHYITF